ncbi:translocation and assembly module lipoprotein TamL [Nonlabens xiamenensis]|uniref:translocation and assembly module lipoprotein TamL n=1 Tax=Nonlabens xiamenensis TaxID=2341043 RepID=UPI000F606EED|nr:BamA/TamA family outer membrane protein [Nonlabens xiamenensis]
MGKTGLYAKIGLFTLLVWLIVSCNAIKRVPDGKLLLMENRIKVDSLEPEDPRVATLPLQQPNQRLLGVPLRLHIYNLARPHRDSIYLKWMQEHPNQLKRRNKLLSEKQTIKLGEGLTGINRWIKRTGEEPSIIDPALITKSEERLKAWYWNQGYFNTEISSEVVEEEWDKRARVEYTITRHKPYIVDSLNVQISSPAIDSLYRLTQSESILENGKQYFTPDINAERERLNSYFRNHGAFHMEKEKIRFEGDTVNTNHKANITMIIGDREIEVADSVVLKPYQIHRISQVNIIPEYQNALGSLAADTTQYKDYQIIRYGKRKYRSKTLTDAVFFHKGDVYRDLDRDRTYRRITELRSFLYPSIRYEKDPADSTGTDLIANVLLTSKKKFEFTYGVEGTHSNIQTIGVGLNTALLIRNLFKGSELLDISFRGNIGASSNAANGDSRFFDLQELGADIRLSFPRLFSPINLDRLIPKYMSPSSDLSVGFFSQTNIGLDKQSLNGALTYNWRQTPIKSTRVDLVNAQYVRNLDPNNFFNVFRSSYGSLNDIAQDLNLMDPTYVNDNNNLSIPDGTQNFIVDAIDGTLPVTAEQREIVRNIRERRERLSQNNLIISSSYSWTRNNRAGIYDEDFSRFNIRLEAAGNVLSGVSSLVGVEKNSNGNRRVFGVEYSQYFKTEIDYIKHWEYTNKHVFAIRTYGGVAIPYGNADNIPFIRSFFAGGPNDNRAWQAYELGPGRTGGLNDFNVANMKLAFNAEYRFPLFGAIKGAIFADAGNIWNVLDSEDDPDAIFNGVKDLEFLALGTGAGLRYDFGFFVLRLDMGLKTYNPALEEGRRWLTEFKLPKSVLNVGINYPF